MKKIITLILASVLIMSLAACKPAESSSLPETSSEVTSSESTSSESSSQTSSEPSSLPAITSSSSSVASSGNPGTGTSYDQWAFEVAAGLSVDVAQVQDVINFFNSKMAENKTGTDFYKAFGKTSEQAKAEYKTFEAFAKAVSELADTTTKK